MKRPQPLLYDDRLDFINEGATLLEGDEMTLLQRVMEQQRRPSRPVTYEDVAKGLAELQARTDELLRIDPHEEPAYHAAAMKYMREHPGTSYDAAAEQVGGKPVIVATVNDAGEATTGPHAAPAHHERAMEYMWANPGMEYDAAARHVCGE